MLTATRSASDETRRGRHTLSLKTWQPRNCSTLAGEEQSETYTNLPEIQAWEARLWDDRNRWDVRRRRAGLFAPHRLIDKNEADRLLRNLLAAHAEGGAK